MSTPRFLDLPANTCRYQLDTSRGRFAVLDGEAAPDQPAAVAVLVPGLNASKEDFLAVLAPLGAAGFRCVAMDLRGQNQSGGGEDDAEYAIDELATDVLAVVESVGGGAPAHRVGHSVGGLIVRAAALANQAAVASVTLLCSGPAAPGPETAGRLRLLLDALRSMSMPEIYAAMVELDRANGLVPPPAPISEFLRQRFLRTRPAHFAGLGAQVLAAPDLVAELAKTGLPTQVVHGAGDETWPIAEQAEMAARLGGVPVVIQGAAHSPAVEQPGPTADALTRFWRSVR